MKSATSKKITLLFSMALIFILTAGVAVIQAQAASNGIYTATATPHYKHPVTGKIEDSGGEGSSVLGQSMTESALFRQALVEVDSQGNTFVTVRLQLMDNIQNPAFGVSTGGNSGFQAVSASLMQEDYTNNTADYRMKVPGENAIIRCNMYVTAMGRDVIFYITISNLSAGSGDFITSITVDTPQPQETPASNTPSPNPSQETPAVTANLPQTPAMADSPAENPGSSAGQSTEVSENNETVDNTETVTGADEQETLSDEETATAGGEKKKSEDLSAKGIEEFDKDGNAVKGKSETKNAEGKKGSLAVTWIVIAVIVLLIGGGTAWYFLIYRRKHQESDYNEDD